MERIPEAHAECAAPCREYDPLCMRVPRERLAAPAIDRILEIAHDGEGESGQARGNPVRPEMETRREAAEFAALRNADSAPLCRQHVGCPIQHRPGRPERDEPGNRAENVTMRCQESLLDSDARDFRDAELGR